jgi:hypothetical protein
MQKLTIITLKHATHGIITDFAAARNKALDKVKSGWVLFVDDDEKVSPELQKEIVRATESNEFDAYRIRRLDTFLGRVLRYGETGRISFVRLAKYNAGRFERPVHETWEIDGRVGELHNPLSHEPHPTITAFLRKINIYSTIEAEYRLSNQVKSSLLHIALFPAGKFIQNYVWRQGFRDGVPGLIMAMMMSFHSYLTWTKLHLLWQRQ